MAELTDSQVARLDAALEGSGCHGFSGDHPELYDTAAAIVREHVTAALDEIETVVAAQREAFLPSPDLDPAWIAGWHSAADHVSHAVRDYRQEQDR
ncbi:hypothetical protein [Pimelobacter simplex]|uniref:hypothetical protein n=1 Tax=Nocardioides simplex TaxID=2045 RepID=UPI003AAC59D3